MNWEMLGAIGEVAGAIGVIATLLYLSLQIRQSKRAIDLNTTAMRTQSIAGVTHNIHTELGFLLQGADVASVIGKISAGTPIEPDERMIADVWFTIALTSRQNEYLQFRDGLLPREVLDSMRHPIVLLMSSEVGQSWWRTEGSKTMAPSFVEYVDQLVAAEGRREWWHRTQP